MTKIYQGDIRYLGMTTNFLYNKNFKKVYKTIPAQSRGMRDTLICQVENTDSRTKIYITPELLEISDFYVINKEEDPEYFI